MYQTIHKTYTTTQIAHRYTVISTYLLLSFLHSLFWVLRWGYIFYTHAQTWLSEAKQASAFSNAEADDFANAKDVQTGLFAY